MTDERARRKEKREKREREEERGKEEEAERRRDTNAQETKQRRTPIPAAKTARPQNDRTTHKHKGSNTKYGTKTSNCR